MPAVYSVVLFGIERIYSVATAIRLYNLNSLVHEVWKREEREIIGGFLQKDSLEDENVINKR
jgi:hypothetical protein